MTLMQLECCSCDDVIIDTVSSKASKIECPGRRMCSMIVAMADIFNDLDGKEDFHEILLWCNILKDKGQSSHSSP